MLASDPRDAGIARGIAVTIADMRYLIDLAYRVRRLAMALVRWRTYGVKVMVFDRDGALLLIRNRYGRGDLWVLPGGGVARGEAPIDAAIREVREETACRLLDPVVIGVLQSRSEGRRDTVHLVRARTDDVPTPDGVEVAEARFFALDALPATVSPATRRRIDEWRGLRERSDLW